MSQFLMLRQAEQVPRPTEPSSQPKDRILTILFPPRMKMVTALEFLHFSITSILSFVVPNEISRTTPAKPSFSGVSSENLGTIRPPVAMAISSISGPPTQRTAGRPF